MGKGSAPDTQTTVTSTEPPEYVRPYIEHALGEARNLYGTSPLYRGVETYTPAETAGMQGIEAAARNPMLTAPATEYARDVIGGQYLQPEAIAEASRPYVDRFLGRHGREWEGAGGTGGSLEAEAAGRGIADVIAAQRGQERVLQQQMAGMAPSLEAARYGPGQALMGLGQIQRARQQTLAQEPWERLARYTGIALGSAPAQLAGGTGMTQQPIYQPSPFSQILGLGLTGLGAASGLGWRPFS